MQNTINLSLSVLMLCLIISSSSCASLSTHLPPTLENRTLRLSDKVPGFEYQWLECTKKILGFCRKWETRVEYYDLTDPEVKMKLQHMGFVARVREKVTP